MAQHKVKIKILTAIGLLAGLLVSGNVLAAEKNILFILDASGSMAQKFGDQTRIEAAKGVFGSLLSDLPDGVDVGLEVYGHHGSRDCSVIEVMNPVGALDAASIKANVQSLTPRHGATPMAAALERGAEALKVSAGEKVIVLISDGRETCGGDPAAVARKLYGKGFDITTHVVSLGVNDKEKAQLSAIATAGGGEYYAANNADELKQGLAEIKKRVVVKKAKVIFQDEFDGEFLSDKWNVINPDGDNMVIEDGHLTVLLQPGWPSEGKTHNILLYSGDLPKSYEISAKFKPKVTTFPNFRPWETQRIGLILYKSKKDFIELNTSTGGVSTGHALIASYGKYKDKGWTSTFSSNLQKIATQEFKLQKAGRKYTAFFKGTKGKWVSIGTVSSLKGKYRPGIVAYRAPNAAETTVEYDWFKITSTE